MNILVIGDPHADPAHGNERFDALAEFILDRKPDHVVCMGDFADLRSLSSYDKGKASAENKRFADDYAAVVDALRRTDAARQHLIRGNRKRPRFHMLIGNHEQRADRYSADRPELMGVMGSDLLPFAEYGWNVVPYRGSDPGHLSICGVTFAHYLRSGRNPISGKNQARRLIDLCQESVVVGHSHTLDYAVGTSVTGRRCMALVAGRYHDWEHGYAGHSNDQFWSGLCMLHDVRDGVYDLETISFDRVMSGRY